MQDNRIERARLFALERHAGLYRNNRTKQPVSIHLEEVAFLVEKAGGNEEAIIAAWLHDSVEDTPTTLDEIAALFGNAVRLLVDDLTDPPTIAPLPLALRKPAQARRLAEKTGDVLLVKLADQISNVWYVGNDPPVDFDKAMCRAYIDGAKAIADVAKGYCPLLDALFDDAYRKADAAFS